MRKNQVITLGMSVGRASVSREFETKGNVSCREKCVKIYTDSMFTEIFGKRALQQVSAEDYAAWAGEMLVQGYDSRSLRILAGLDRSTSTFEAESYFARSLAELNLTPPDPDAAIRTYACEIARQISEDKITARDGVRALVSICIATECARDFIIWLELDEAFESLMAGHYPFTYQSATLDNFDEIAKLEAANFIAAVTGMK
jgi:hypothetical protein